MFSKKFSNVEMVWQPKGNFGKNIKKFKKRIVDKYNVTLNDYWDLHKWSIENLEEFWAEIWHFSNIICSKSFDKVIDLSIPMENSPRWFEGAKLNYAENLMKYRDDHVALISTGEESEVTETTYAEMYEEATLYAAALRKFGLKKGDIAACYMSNRKEAILPMLGVTSIGAIFTGALPQLGAQAVVNRFKLVKPRILFSIDRFQHNKEEIDMLTKLVQITEELPCLEKVVIVPSKEESKLKDISRIKNSCFLDEFLNSGKDADGSVVPITFEQVPFSHPVFISYTSGTTGLPKALINDAGLLLSVAKDSVSYGEGDRNRIILSMSPVGWASWNITSTLHFLGCTTILYEGFPYFISPTSIWDMVDQFKITNLSFAASILDDLEKKGYLPTEKHSLESLKAIGSGGSVVKPQTFDFIYKKVKRDVIFTVAYGSTELMGAALRHDYSLPIYKGEIPAPCLGIAVECLNEEGQHVVGEPGKLVLAKPVPSLVLGLWGDNDGTTFKKLYFSEFPGKFSLGDSAIINPITKGYIICGRSDATLKQRGCRFGSSEIYNIVDKFPEIVDSICVSQYSKNLAERAVLFLKIKEGYQFNKDLESRIREMIGSELTPRHIPEVILEVPDIPYNINGKKVEIIVKKIINNMPYDPESVVNKECLKIFHDMPELQGFED
ncbi:acetoacetyl-CoA synthetase-like [Stegodyphus dumicola]|uniref:acetoacetyl-CoA synthetase-like n=1 Tax=Stegodyphus dumicola TaxID=202533 RepID=UPI0015AFFF2F|nr:acetoacetyl-CoA synthetase-like [Stegodyphus dumicola]